MRANAVNRRVSGAKFAPVRRGAYVCGRMKKKICAQTRKICKIGVKTVALCSDLW